ncbi:putative nucleic acid-binding protein [Helianthus anomalus]
MEHPGVAELRPSKSAPAIHVRVLRSWVPDYRDNELHFLVVDQEGLGIQVVTKDDDCTNVRSRLQLQGCYEIKCYACIKVDDFTAVITHPAMIRLGTASVITPIADTAELPTQYFEFASKRKMELEAQKQKGIIGMIIIQLKTFSKRMFYAWLNTCFADFIGVYLKIEDKKSKADRPFVVLTLRDSR